MVLASNAQVFHHCGIKSDKSPKRLRTAGDMILMSFPTRRSIGIVESTSQKQSFRFLFMVK